MTETADKTVPFVTTQETEAATKAIADARHAAAAATLTSLAVAIMDCVKRLDEQTNLKDYLKSLTLVVEGPGVFRLDIHDNVEMTSEASEQLRRTIAEEARKGNSHYRTRILELSDDNDRSDEERATAADD